MAESCIPPVHIDTDRPVMNTWQKFKYISNDKQAERWNCMDEMSRYWRNIAKATMHWNKCAINWTIALFTYRPSHDEIMLLMKIISRACVLSGYCYSWFILLKGELFAFGSLECILKLIIADRQHSLEINLQCPSILVGLLFTFGYW